MESTALIYLACLAVAVATDTPLGDSLRASLDRDQNGVITLYELQNSPAAQKQSPELRKAEASVLMGHYDRDQNGLIDVTELYTPSPAGIVGLYGDGKPATVGCTCARDSEYCERTTADALNLLESRLLCAVPQVVVEMETHATVQIVQANGCHTLAVLLAHAQRSGEEFKSAGYDGPLAARVRKAMSDASRSFPNLHKYCDRCTWGSCGEHGTCDNGSGKCQCQLFHLQRQEQRAGAVPLKNGSVSGGSQHDCDETLTHCLRSHHTAARSCFKRWGLLNTAISTVMFLITISVTCCCHRLSLTCCYSTERRRHRSLPPPPGLRRPGRGGRFRNRAIGPEDEDDTNARDLELDPTQAAPQQLIAQLRKTVRGSHSMPAYLRACLHV